MTWSFIYLVLLVVGLTLSAVTGLGRTSSRGETGTAGEAPLPDVSTGALKHLTHWVAYGMAVVGLVGLPLSAWKAFPPALTAALAGTAGMAVTLLGRASARPTVRGSAPDRGAVVRSIKPGGFGQVQVERAGTRVILAARSVDDEEIPAGSEVDIVESSRSVLTVRQRFVRS